MLLRQFGAILLGLAGLYACLGLLVSLISLDHTIANAQRLNRQFRQVAAVIETFQHSKSRFPTSIELKQLLPLQLADAYEIALYPGGFDQCESDPKTFQGLGNNEYVLVAWRGEWWECYVPSRGKTTLALAPEEFTVTGRLMVDRISFVIFAIFSFCSAFFLWRGTAGLKRSAS
jgi:hypothetical protein